MITSNFDGEIIGDVIEAAFDIAADSSSGRKDNRPGGCFVVILIVIIATCVIWYFSS